MQRRGEGDPETPFSLNVSELREKVDSRKRPAVPATFSFPSQCFDRFYYVPGIPLTHLVLSIAQRDGHYSYYFPVHEKTEAQRG